MASYANICLGQRCSHTIHTTLDEPEIDTAGWAEWLQGSGEHLSV
jgi:hypothetical protein